jgi:hypothetical protein
MQYALIFYDLQLILAQMTPATPACPATSTAHTAPVTAHEPC